VATLVKLPSGRTRPTRAWSSDEARAFLESAKRDQDLLYAAFVLVLVLGLRKGEVLGLTWSDVDFGAAELTVVRQLQRVRRTLLHRETKTETSDATLPLPDICLRALRLRRDQQEAEREKAGAKWQEGGFVFSGGFGLPVDPRTFNRVFARRCTLAEVRPITVHDARRTCASLLVDLDVHPRVVMQVLRHAQFAVTMEVYSKVASRSTRAALRRLGDSLTEQ
jgi:integrase